MTPPKGYSYNAPPGWEVPTDGWVPEAGWVPDPSWPPAPAGWQFWVKADPAPAEFADDEETGSAAVVVNDLAPTPDDASSDSPASDDGPEVEVLRQRVSELEAEVARLASANTADGGVVELDDEQVLQEVGIYRYHHPLENAAEYKDALGELNERIKEMVKSGAAVLASDLFTFNNSLAKGRRMTAEFSKLMLRAYNAEADNCVRTLRAGNVVTAKKRLEAAVASIAKLGAMMEMRVNPEYHALRVKELELTADYLMKVQVEKEEARAERERLREERKAEQELAAQRAKLGKEREHYANALRAMIAKGDEAEVAELEQRLSEIDEAIEQNDFRAANIRAGYVYIISNPGALGTHVVKIGMTRRLEPLDRVRELGDASVPFPFEVHALFFSDDAVTVEAELHKAFAERRVNHVNQRREFFFASPSDVRDVLLEKVGSLLEFVERPESTEYLQSKGSWPVDVADSRREQEHAAT